MNKYLSDLRNALKKTNLTSIEIEDILNDYRDMIETALEEGLKTSDIAKKFGEVETLAQALGKSKEAEDTEKTEPSSAETELCKHAIDTEKPFEIVVSCAHETVRYQETEDEHLIVLIKNGNAADYDISFKENILRIESEGTSGVLGSFMNAFKSGKRNTVFTVCVPKNIKIERLKHQSASGDIVVKGIDVVLMNVRTTSGDTTIQGEKLGNVRINVVSGDIDMNVSRASNVKLSMVSGDAAIETMTIQETLEMSTVSGDMAIRDVSCDTCYVSSVSGNVKGTEFYPKKIALKSVSGDITIKNTEDKSIEVLRKQSISGSIKIKSA